MESHLASQSDSEAHFLAIINIKQLELHDGKCIEAILYAGSRYIYIAKFLLHILIRQTARDLTLDAAQAAGSARQNLGRSRELSTEQVKKLLSSRFEKEVLEGLRRVISVSNNTRQEGNELMQPDDLSEPTMFGLLLGRGEECRQSKH